MNTHDPMTKVLLIVIVLLLGALVIRDYVQPGLRVSAESGRFEYVHVVSPSFLYKGMMGVLLLDKRNGNVWFTARSNEMKLFYHDPVFVVRVPLEKLTEGAQPDPSGQ